MLVLPCRPLRGAGHRHRRHQPGGRHLQLGPNNAQLFGSPCGLDTTITDTAERFVFPIHMGLVQRVAHPRGKGVVAFRNDEKDPFIVCKGFLPTAMRLGTGHSLFRRGQAEPAVVGPSKNHANAPGFCHGYTPV